MTKAKGTREVHADHLSTKAKWQTMRNHIVTFKRNRAKGSKQSVRSYVKENNLPYQSFNLYVNGSRTFPATWDECLGNRARGSHPSTCNELAKRDSFARNHIDTEFGADLRVAFKAEFSELYTDWDNLSVKAKNRVHQQLKIIREKIAKLRAERDSLAAAASSVAEHDSDNDDSDDDGDFL